ncbi:MAG TPA: ABC transporter ATP-binding protein [Azospirillaceae bacterium]|nr:ABC transporter ATP-binding protein [Azospirillaceae bacterium]
MQPIISIEGLEKTYASGHQALKGIDLQVGRGEIFALLGPNGAGKTTLIAIACGLVTATGGRVLIGGHDTVRDYRRARSMVGLVPQELHTDAFEPVHATVAFSRGLFGRPPDPGFIDSLLRDLSLWDKRDAMVKELSGGMKRRVMIAKALSHQPEVLFLDEPTAGVDVALRRDMWQLVRRLRDQGVTIVLTTHYIEEAEEMADRVGVIDKGALVLVEEKAALMRKMGRRELRLTLAEPLAAVPEALAAWKLELGEGGRELRYVFDAKAERTGVPSLMAGLRDSGIAFTDLETRQSSLEDIFVSLVGGGRP